MSKFFRTAALSATTAASAILGAAGLASLADFSKEAADTIKSERAFEELKNCAVQSVESDSKFAPRIEDIGYAKMLISGSKSSGESDSGLRVIIDRVDVDSVKIHSWSDSNGAADSIINGTLGQGAGDYSVDFSYHINEKIPLGGKEYQKEHERAVDTFKDIQTCVTSKAQIKPRI